MRERMQLFLNTARESGKELLSKHKANESKKGGIKKGDIKKDDDDDDDDADVLSKDMNALMIPFIHVRGEAREKLKLKSDEIAFALQDKILNRILRSFRPRRRRRGKGSRVVNPAKFERYMCWLEESLNLIIV